jgi:hypothetical protein
VSLCSFGVLPKARPPEYVVFSSPGQKLAALCGRLAFFALLFLSILLSASTCCEGNGRDGGKSAVPP